MTRKEAIKCLVQEVGIRAECYRSYLEHYGKQDKAEEDFLDALYSAIDALREQESAKNAHCNCCKKGNSWISVEDEKPKRRGHYFVAYKFPDSDMRFYGEAMWHDDVPDNGYVQRDHFSHEGFEGMYVTHWMKIPKLPEPPTEEEV